jgi:hypothetical protein
VKERCQHFLLQEITPHSRPKLLDLIGREVACAEKLLILVKDGRRGRATMVGRFEETTADKGPAVSCAHNRLANRPETVLSGIFVIL